MSLENVKRCSPKVVEHENIYVLFEVHPSTFYMIATSNECSIVLTVMYLDDMKTKLYP